MGDSMGAPTPPSGLPRWKPRRTRPTKSCASLPPSGLPDGSRAWTLPQRADRKPTDTGRRRASPNGTRLSGDVPTAKVVGRRRACPDGSRAWTLPSRRPRVLILVPAAAKRQPEQWEGTTSST